MSLVDAFVGAVTDGPVLVAAAVAATAGLVSFLSPCVLPLVPGYLSYMTGVTGLGLAVGAEEAEATEPAAPSGGSVVRVRSAPATASRARLLLAAVLFVSGFTAVFVSAGAFFGGVGGELVANKVLVDRVLGVLTVLLGLSFLGLLPWTQREWRFRRLPTRGLWGAPLLGVVFGVGWTPCLGPTLAAVQTLAYTQASAGRGAALTAAYCVGLGLPFLLTALAYDRALRAFTAVRRHSVLVTRVGGVLIVVVGLLLVSGLWELLMIQVRGLVAGFTTPV